MKKKEKKPFREKKFLRTPFDMALILDVLFLNLFGIIMIYSASYYYASVVQKLSPANYLISQTEYLAVGLVLMIITAYIRPGFWRYFGWPFLLIAFLFVIAVRIPGLGKASHGAYRWIKIGSRTLQVAEPVKVCLIIFMATFMTRYRITNKFVFFSIFIIFIILAGMLLVLSNNMSTAIVIMMMLFFTMLVNYPRPKWFIIVAICGVILAVLLVLYIDRYTVYDPEENFRITRIRAWLHPTDPRYVSDQAYQATQALYAIASGGFFGKGLGQSLIKYVLPEPHNDYILAIVFEELGICGAIILTFLFIYLLYRIFLVWLNSRKRFSRILCLGVFFHIAFQVLINYAVTLGLFPTTGVTLTFISAGGTAVLFTLIEIGLVLAVDRENKERVLYFNADKELKEEDPAYKEAAEKEPAAVKETPEKPHRRKTGTYAARRH